MKIEVSGKGGSGKSTLSVLMAGAFHKMGRRVLLVDGDESNIGLERLAGVAGPVHLLDHLGGKKGFKGMLNQAMMTGNPAGLFAGTQTLDDLPAECVAQGPDGPALLAIGKIHHFGEGCACPMGVLSKKFLAGLRTCENEVVIMDAEAGVEHFGRGVAGECDLLLGVVDPTAESFLLAEKMARMAGDAKKPIRFVLNKVEPEILDYMAGRLDPALVIGFVPKHPGVFAAGLRGEAVRFDIPEIQAICRKIDEMMLVG